MYFTTQFSVIYLIKKKEVLNALFNASDCLSVSCEKMNIIGIFASITRSKVIREGKKKAKKQKERKESERKKQNNK